MDCDPSGKALPNPHNTKAHDLHPITPHHNKRCLSVAVSIADNGESQAHSATTDDAFPKHHNRTEYNPGRNRCA